MDEKKQRDANMSDSFNIWNCLTRILKQPLYKYSHAQLRTCLKQMKKIGRSSKKKKEEGEGGGRDGGNSLLEIVELKHTIHSLGE